jgi:hypothetical protein
MGDFLDLGTDDVTLLALVRYSAAAQPDEWSGQHVGAIAGKGHLDAGSRGYGLSVNNSNLVYWQVRNQGSNFSVVSDDALNDGQYHLAVGVCDRDSTTGVRLYIDGIRQTGTADPTPIDGYDLSGTRAFAVGSRQEESGGTWFWDFAGTVAAVCAWKRVLTEAEIRRLRCDPFALFAARRAVALLTLPGGATVDCSGSATTQTTVSGAIRVTRNVCGSAHGTTSASAAARVVRGVAGTIAVSTTLTAVLTKSGLVLVAGAVNAVTGLYGVLSTVPPAKPFDAMLEIEASWLREALFNGMTATAFKLGTALTRGWFWMRRGGCTALYGGATPAQVDFSRILHTVDAGTGEFSLPAYLSPPAGSSRCYLVRRFNGCGYQERTTAAAVIVRITPDGQLESSAPNAVLGLPGEPLPGPKLRLTWSYCPLGQATLPERFNVYWDAGTGQMDLANPLAAIPYRGRKFYQYDSGVLPDGSYMFLVRARSAKGVESIAPAGVIWRVASAAPEPVSILAAQSI